MDHTGRDQHSTVIDDSTGEPTGVQLPVAVQDALKAAGLSLKAPTRWANGGSGTAQVADTLFAHVNQHAYFVSAAATVVLPMFKKLDKPFVMVFWSRDPDGTQHNQGDSLGHLAPGINGPTSLAAVRNADNNVGIFVWV